jgi:hypothetical protein
MFAKVFAQSNLYNLASLVNVTSLNRLYTNITEYMVKLEAARRRGQTAIGYRKTSEASEAGKSYGVHTNPRKSEQVTFATEDKIIVIAED